MRVAIIGGGASGMICAHLLDRAHAVTVFEKAPVLGGHIRTLGKNARRGGVPADLVLDNGVIEFEPRAFPFFHRLLDELGVETARLPGTTGLFLGDGRFLLSAGAIPSEGGSFAHQLDLYGRLAPLAAHDQAFCEEVACLVADSDALREASMADLFGDDLHCVWLRMLLMYAYSTPYAETPEIAAAIGGPVLAQMTQTTEWTRIVGGVYTYIERILEGLRGEVHTSAPVASVERRTSGVMLTLADGNQRDFDAVVFAGAPEAVLCVLADPTDDERRRFGAWRAREVDTVIHTDFSIYDGYEVHRFSEFDLFEKAGGHDAGYNAYLNRLNGIEGAPAYGLAYNLEDRIDPAKILQVERHVAPHFCVEALRYREEVIADNGNRGTFFAGAWLGDGLHEGAATSAHTVAELMGAPG